MDRAILNSSRFLTLATVVAAGFLCGCVPDYTTNYDPRVDGLSPMQTASAEPGILDDQKNLPHINAAMPNVAKPPAATPAPAGATPPVESATPSPAPASSTPPPPPSGDQDPPPPPDAAPATSPAAG